MAEPALNKAPGDGTDGCGNPRSSLSFQALPGTITLPLPTRSQLVTLSRKPDTKGHKFEYFRAVVPALRLPDWSAMDDASVAAYLEYGRARQPVPPGYPDVIVEDRTIAPGLSVRLYRPTAGRPDAPVAVYFHGGGWAIGNVTLNGEWSRDFVRKTGWPMVSVEYRLAPEHPYPAPLDDCAAATRWAVAHALEFGGDREKIILLGLSAGGNLAAAVALQARETGLRIAAQVLICPALDNTCATPSYEEFSKGFFLEGDQMRWFWDQYVPDEAERTSPLVAPARATDLSGLPYTIVLTAGLDPLRDEGAQYADRLARAGVRVEYRCYDGQLHGFFSFPAFTATAVARAELVSLLLAEFG